MLHQVGQKARLNAALHSKLNFKRKRKKAGKASVGVTGLPGASHSVCGLKLPLLDTPSFFFRVDTPLQHVCVLLYTYIYRERVRTHERQRERARESEGERLW